MRIILSVIVVLAVKDEFSIHSCSWYSCDHEQSLGVTLNTLLDETTEMLVLLCQDEKFLTYSAFTLFYLLFLITFCRGWKNLSHFRIQVTSDTVSHSVPLKYSVIQFDPKLDHVISLDHSECYLIQIVKIVLTVYRQDLLVEIVS